MANRLTLVFRSPLTGAIAWANTGGYAASELKKAGFDAIVVTGASREPVYLLVDSGRVELVEASGIWGLGAFDAVTRLRARHGDSRVLAIGPAGENLVRFANVVNDMGRASGVRLGVGAVMGSKRLKAVVIPSPQRMAPGVADRRLRLEASKAAASRIRASRLLNKETGLLAVYGTPIAVDALGRNDAIPYKNYRYTRVEGYERVSGEAMRRSILISRLTCSYCPVMCRRETASGGRYSFRVEGPDYAQISSLGTNNALLDLEAIAYLNYLSYDLGLDPIEAGNVMALLAEITEEAGLGGEGLRWGDAGRMAELLGLTAVREGIGAVIAEGADALASRLGYPGKAVTVKGATIQNTDPRVEPAWGLINAVEAYGGAAHIWVYGDLVKSLEAVGVPQLIGDHGDPREVAAKTAYKQRLVAALDSLQVCAFSSYALAPEDYAIALKAVTGAEFTASGLLAAGDRILDLERAFNESVGIAPSADRLPPRFTEEPVPDGRHKGKTCDLEPMKEAYYEERGLDGGHVPRGRRVELESLARQLLSG
jgi:aldehyde:ferredoxin oxidoreductase